MLATALELASCLSFHSYLSGASSTAGESDSHVSWPEQGGLRRAPPRRRHRLTRRRWMARVPSRLAEQANRPPLQRTLPPHQRGQLRRPPRRRPARRHRRLGRTPPSPLWSVGARRPRRGGRRSPTAVVRSLPARASVFICDPDSVGFASLVMRPGLQAGKSSQQGSRIPCCRQLDLVSRSAKLPCGAEKRSTRSSWKFGWDDDELVFESGAEHGGDEVAVDAFGVEGVL